MQEWIVNNNVLRIKLSDVYAIHVILIFHHYSII